MSLISSQRKKIQKQEDKDSLMECTPLPSLTSEIKQGNILISHPSLNDEFFQSVLLIIQHHSVHGTQAVVLDRHFSSDKLSPFWNGGPVEVKGNLMLHTNAITSGTRVTTDLYYSIVPNTELSLHTNQENCRVFTSYSTWVPDQLQRELDKGIWILAECPQEVLFGVQENGLPDLGDKDKVKKSSDLWKKVLRLMGGEFAIFSYIDEPETTFQRMK